MYTKNKLMKKLLFNNKVLFAIIIVLLVLLGVISYKYSKINTLYSELSESTSETQSIDELWSADQVSIENVYPSDGYDTGLSQFPKLTWYNAVIKHEEPNIDIDTSYPQFIGQRTTKLNQYINDLVKNLIEEDRVRLKELLNSSDNEVGESTHIYITSSYRVTGVKNGVISIEFIVTDFTGGGNGNHDYPITINWDLKSNRLLKNSELFCKKDYISNLMPLVRKEIVKNFSNSKYMEQPLDPAIISWVNEGTENNIDNWKFFVLNKKGLVTIFSSYQVTSGASGIVRALIPYSDIPNLICLP
jgi:hypothetical protein